MEQEYFQLPCGYLTKEGVLYPYLKVREMDGSEEDKLTSKKNRKNNKWLEEIVCSCCMLSSNPEDMSHSEIPISREIFNEMTLGDRFTALIRIRQMTYGKTYKFEFTCSNESCAKKNSYALDLNSLELDMMENPRQREYTVLLPRKQEELTFRVATGIEEDIGNKLLSQYPDAEATCDLASRLISVNGKSVSNPVKYLQSLSIIDRQSYRDAINAAEGTIQVVLKDVECKSCKNTSDMAIPTQQSFFLPASEK